MAADDKTLGRGKSRFEERVQFRQLHKPYAADFHCRIFPAELGNPVGEPGIGQRLQRR